ncbi:hypothetical protein [Streptomyces sp. LN325]|uniref:hypothetical protein n=1 Tax=Streptomyces sp. LN325 TaxID=3112976 RepID=UPI00370FA285
MEPGPLQADSVTLEELRRMVRTADRTTARGRQVAVTLIGVEGQEGDGVHHAMFGIVRLHNLTIAG